MLTHCEQLEFEALIQILTNIIVVGDYLLAIFASGPEENKEEKREWKCGSKDMVLERRPPEEMWQKIYF